ncbi:MAG TPA: hypothetical protein ENJ09_01775 [Planctomycetes bacterium]|nr:hypothetical protein [Planctomycetota bacterium]
MTDRFSKNADLEARLRRDARNVHAELSPGFRSRLLVSIRSRARRQGAPHRTSIPRFAVAAALLAALVAGAGWWWRRTTVDPGHLARAGGTPPASESAKGPRLLARVTEFAPVKRAASRLEDLGIEDSPPERPLERESRELLEDVTRAVRGFTGSLPPLLRRPFGS